MFADIFPLALTDKTSPAFQYEKQATLLKISIIYCPYVHLFHCMYEVFLLKIKK